MDIPNKKNASSPITGRSSKKKKAKGSAVPKPPPPAAPAAPAAPEDDEAEDLEIADEVFETPVISLPPRTSPPKEISKEISKEVPKETPAAISRQVNPPPPPRPAEKEPEEERGPKKEDLEHREPPAPYQFKRLIRPATAMAASAAADLARAESPASLESVDHTAMQFGKIHPQGTPDYRPNRLFRVLDSIYTHSPLRWLDFVERGGVRLVAGTIILLIVGGFVAWRYYDSLSAAKETEAGAAKEITLSVPERMDLAKKAVQEYMASQTMEARLPLVMDPERAAPRMQQFYGAMKGQDPNVVTWEVGEPRAGKQGAWLPFIFQDSAGRKVTVPIEETDKGCRIDWENFVAFGDMPWPEFCAPPHVTESKTMRVRLRRAEIYGGSYTTEKYQAYEIEHRSGTTKLLGYIERASRPGQTLAELVKGDQWQSAQLYLQFQSSGVGNQVTILDIVRSRWQDEATSWTGP